MYRIHTCERRWVHQNRKSDLCESIYMMVDCADTLIEHHNRSDQKEAIANYVSPRNRSGINPLPQASRNRACTILLIDSRVIPTEGDSELRRDGQGVSGAFRRTVRPFEFLTANWVRGRSCSGSMGEEPLFASPVTCWPLRGSLEPTVIKTAHARVRLLKPAQILL